MPGKIQHCIVDRIGFLPKDKKLMLVLKFLSMTAERQAILKERENMKKDALISC